MGAANAPSPPAERDVIVAGAGMPGLAAALTATQPGARVRFVDEAATWLEEINPREGCRQPGGGSTAQRVPR